eukprot:365509-Chlamydomonas_euryale.AAC.23
MPGECFLRACGVCMRGNRVKQAHIAAARRVVTECRTCQHSTAGDLKRLASELHSEEAARRLGQHPHSCLAAQPEGGPASGPPSRRAARSAGGQGGRRSDLLCAQW